MPHAIFYLNLIADTLNFILAPAPRFSTQETLVKNGGKQLQVVKLFCTFLTRYIMTPSHPKRRKIDHTSSNDSSEDDHLGSDSEKHEHVKPAPRSLLEKEPRRSNPRAPSTDNAALYAGESYRSTLFKLQVDELLAEVKPNYEKRLAGVNEALRRLKSSIEEIEDREPLSVSS